MSLFKPVLSNEALLRVAPVLNATRKAVISIIKPGQTDSSYDFDTGDYNGLANTVVLANAAARVQPVRSVVRRDVTGNETEIKAILVTLGLEHSALDITLGMKVVVHSTEMSTPLPSYEFYINDYANSSNPLERAFYCGLNLEVSNVQ